MTVINDTSALTRSAKLLHDIVLKVIKENKEYSNAYNKRNIVVSETLRDLDRSNMLNKTIEGRAAKALKSMHNFGDAFDIFFSPTEDDPKGTKRGVKLRKLVDKELKILAKDKKNPRIESLNGRIHIDNHPLGKTLDGDSGNYELRRKITEKNIQDDLPDNADYAKKVFENRRKLLDSKKSSYEKSVREIFPNWFQPREDFSCVFGKPKLEATDSVSPSFSEAFAQAREKKSETFDWNGKPYTTKLKEEITRVEPDKGPTMEKRQTSIEDPRITEQLRLQALIDAKRNPSILENDLYREQDATLPDNQRFFDNGGLGGLGSTSRTDALLAEQRLLEEEQLRKEEEERLAQEELAAQLPPETTQSDLARLNQEEGTGLEPSDPRDRMAQNFSIGSGIKEPIRKPQSIPEPELFRQISNQYKNQFNPEPKPEIDPTILPSNTNLFERADKKLQEKAPKLTKLEKDVANISGTPQDEAKSNKDLAQSNPETKVTYDSIMKEIQDSKKEFKDSKQKAAYLQLMMEALQTLTKFSTTYAAATAQANSGMQFKAPEYQFKQYDFLKQASEDHKDRMETLLAQAKFIKEIKDKKGDYQMVTLENEKGIPTTYAINKKDPTDRMDLGIRGYSERVVKDPYTGELVDSRDYVRGKQAEKTHKVLYKTVNDLDPLQRKYIEDIAGEYRKDITEVDDFVSTMNSIDQYVEKNIDGTISVIKRQLARTVGQEKGVMTDKDVAAFGGTDKVVDGIAQYAHAKVHGGMTPYIQKNFNEILKVAKDNIALKRSTVENKYIKPVNFRLAGKASPEFVKQALGIDELDTSLTQFNRSSQSYQDSLIIRNKETGVQKRLQLQDALRILNDPKKGEKYERVE